MGDELNAVFAEVLHTPVGFVGAPFEVAEVPSGFGTMRQFSGPGGTCIAPSTWPLFIDSLGFITYLDLQFLPDEESAGGCACKFDGGFGFAEDEAVLAEADDRCGCCLHCPCDVVSAEPEADVTVDAIEILPGVFIHVFTDDDGEID